jgi:hypothetical protein
MNPVYNSWWIGLRCIVSNILSSSYLDLTMKVSRNFLKKEIELCINNLTCIVEASTIRYFVYGGDIEGIVLNTNEFIGLASSKDD